MASKGELIDYYGILNLPPRADLMGIENAYARISDDLTKQARVDDTSNDALKRVNEAYAVLSKPDLRREYDQVFFRDEIATAEKLASDALRRQAIRERTLIGALLLVVLGQAAMLAYIGWDQLSRFF